MLISRKNIEKLIKSGITAYRISKDTGITLYSVQRMISGETDLDNITLKNAEILNKYYLTKVANHSSKKLVKYAKFKAFDHIVGTEKRELIEVTENTTFLVEDLIQEALDKYVSRYEVEFEEHEELEQLDPGYYAVETGDYNYYFEVFELKKTIIKSATELYEVELEAQEMANKYFEDTVVSYELISTDLLENNKVKNYVALDSDEKIVGTFTITICYDRFIIELDRKED